MPFLCQAIFILGVFFGAFLFGAQLGVHNPEVAQYPGVLRDDV